MDSTAGLLASALSEQLALLCQCDRGVRAVKFPSRFVLKRAAIITLVVASMSITISTGIRLLAGVKSDNITILVRTILPLVIAFPISVVVFSWLERLEAAYTKLLKEAQDLAKQAHTDPLTGLLNRRSFEAQFDSAMRLRSGGKFILADVDYLKQINDRHGHLIGDDAIMATASALSAVMGDGCLIARIGGDEFCAFVPHARVKEAEQLSGEINMIAAQEFRTRSGLKNVPLSISVGAQQCQPGTSFREIMSRTDSDLYRKKVRRPAHTLAMAELAAHKPDSEHSEVAEGSHIERSSPARPMPKSAQRASGPQTLTSELL